MRTLGVPSESAALRQLAQRVYNLERARRDKEAPQTLTEVAVFSSAETPTVSESGPYDVHTGGDVYDVVARCRVAGTTNSTVDVKHNGTVIATVTIAANALRGVVYPTRNIPKGSYITAAVTKVGTGVRAISVFVRMRT